MYNLSTYRCSTHNIPDNIDKSWYRGIHITFISIKKCSRNTDGGKEDCTTFSSIKIAMIALQKSLNADLLITIHTALGHTFWFIKIAMIALQKLLNADLLITIQTALGHSY